MPIHFLILMLLSRICIINHLEGMLKPPDFWALHSRVSNSFGTGKAPKFCIADNFQVMLMILIEGSHLEINARHILWDDYFIPFMLSKTFQQTFNIYSQSQIFSLFQQEDKSDQKWLSPLSATNSTNYLASIPVYSTLHPVLVSKLSMILNQALHLGIWFQSLYLLNNFALATVFSFSCITVLFLIGLFPLE